MKRYRADFNNGKVFELSKELGSTAYKLKLSEHTYVYLDDEEYEKLGATITEIEEPRKQFWIKHSGFCLGNDVDAGLMLKSTEPDDVIFKSNDEPWVRVVELRAGEKIFDRKAIEKAFYEFGYDPDSQEVRHAIEELGFKS
jgi:hypothetical protein